MLAANEPIKLKLNLYATRPLKTQGFTVGNGIFLARRDLTVNDRSNLDRTESNSHDRYILSLDCGSLKGYRKAL